jgi:hypothetical protein
VLTSEAESTRLWKHVLYGAGTIAGVIHGYAKLGLPGDPREGIQSIIDVLNDALGALNNSEVGDEVRASGS